MAFASCYLYSITAAWGLLLHVKFSEKIAVLSAEYTIDLQHEGHDTNNIWQNDATTYSIQ